jgi:hypothetical protein
LTTLADGTYELILEPNEGISEAQVNVTKGLSEAPNPRSEDTNITDLVSPVKASLGALSNILNYALILLYIYLVH